MDFCLYLKVFRSGQQFSGDPVVCCTFMNGEETQETDELLEKKVEKKERSGGEGRER
jgi:hypothetical protein